MNSWAIWALILGLGSVTFAMRVAFLLRKASTLPATSEPGDAPDQDARATEPRLLRHVSPSMLAALLIPPLLGGPGTVFRLSYALAGLMGLAVALWSASQPAWRKATVPLTILSSLGTIWLLTLVGV